MRDATVRKIQRIILLISFVALLGMGLIAARIAGYGLPGADGVPPQGVNRAIFNKQVALISGHAGSDSGAVCEDETGKITLAEVDVNAKITKLAAKRLRKAGADVIILEEYDPRLEGLQADVLLSLHADSCIDASGYKAAVDERHATTVEETRLLDCINEFYPAATGIPHHPNSVTHNMTEYHAFRRVDPSTPAAILEMGFLGGDQALLTRSPKVVAKGVTDSVLCFFDPGFGREE